MRNSMFLCLILLVTFSACKKKSSDACRSSIELSADNATPDVGDDATITVTRQNENDIYHWDGPDLHELNQNENLLLTDLKVSQRGWYYCTAENPDCNTALTDSFYLDVRLVQEEAACTPATNTVTGNAIPDVVFNQMIKGLDPTYNGLALQGYAGVGYPEVEVMFNSYNGNAEPEDGVYTTVGVQVFDPFDEPNAISVSFIYASTYFHSVENQQVYVKHVNGKLQAVFCDMLFSSDVPGARCTGNLREF